MEVERRFLVTGWFSFEEVVATIGDLLVSDIVCAWLEEAGAKHDVALAPFMDGGVNWRCVARERYTDVVFACGPFMRHELLDDLRRRFKHCRFTAVNISLLDEADRGRLDAVFERDSARHAQADLSFLAAPRLAPVVGLAFAPPQDEYDGRHEAVAAAVKEVVRARSLPTVDVDTDLFGEEEGPRSPEQVESILVRTDVVATTRLHGLVLALKNGIPAIAIDPVPGGAKISRQARAIGWPVVLRAEDVAPASVARALDRCLSGAVDAHVERCAAAGRAQAEETKRAFLRDVAAPLLQAHER
jgi:hypothetical protein